MERKHQKGVLWVLLFTGLFLLAFVSQTFADGEALFQEKCVGCHSIGEGKRVGPDLAGITDRLSHEWLIAMIHSPKKLIDQGDPEAKKLLEEYKVVMPDQPLSDEEIKQVLAFIAKQSGLTEKKRDIRKDKKESEFTREQKMKGASLFSGAVPFQKGGAPCISCHAVATEHFLSGGSLAKDLTDVYFRLDDAGIKSVLKGLPFPAMQQVFGRKPLTEDEIISLVAFLQSVGFDPDQKYASIGALLPAMGGGGFLLLMGLFSVVWRGRKRGSINAAVFARQISSEDIK